MALIYPAGWLRSKSTSSLLSSGSQDASNLFREGHLMAMGSVCMPLMRHHLT